MVLAWFAWLVCTCGCDLFGSLGSVAVGVFRLLDLWLSTAMYILDGIREGWMMFYDVLLVCMGLNTY